MLPLAAGVPGSVSGRRGAAAPGRRLRRRRRQSAVGDAARRWAARRRGSRRGRGAGALRSRLGCLYVAGPRTRQSVSVVRRARAPRHPARRAHRAHRAGEPAHRRGQRAAAARVDRGQPAGHGDGVRQPAGVVPYSPKRAICDVHGGPQRPHGGDPLSLRRHRCGSNRRNSAGDADAWPGRADCRGPAWRFRICPTPADLRLVEALTPCASCAGRRERLAHHVRSRAQRDRRPRLPAVGSARRLATCQ